MVDVTGHLGMALLWAAPAWVAWGRHTRVSLLFVAAALATALLPDVDLVLQTVTPIDHHGVTHTVLFVTLVVVPLGLVLGRVLGERIERDWLGGIPVPGGSLAAFLCGGLLVGGYSHLFADMLSAPDIAGPIQPFWPLFEKPWAVDVAWYNDPWWNVGLLAAAVALNLVLAYVTYERGLRAGPATR